MRYLYSCRFVPIGKRVNIPKVDGSAWYTEFHDRSFAPESTWEKQPDVCVRHDEDCVVGTVDSTPVAIEAGFSGLAITCEAGDVVCGSGGTVVVEVLGVVTDGRVEVVFPPMTTGRRS